MIPADSPAAPRRLAIVSGGFDPLHIGHVRMMHHAAYYGEVCALVNSDAWLVRKKGIAVSPVEHRLEMVQALRSVAFAAEAQDDDGTVCSSLRWLREYYPRIPMFFCNGGDRGRENTPEQPVCEELNIDMLWSVGGEDKPESSSEIMRRIAAHESRRG